MRIGAAFQKMGVDSRRSQQQPRRDQQTRRRNNQPGQERSPGRVDNRVELRAVDTDTLYLEVQRRIQAVQKMKQRNLEAIASGRFDAIERYDTSAIPYPVTVQSFDPETGVVLPTGEQKPTGTIAEPQTISAATLKAEALFGHFYEMKLPLGLTEEQKAAYAEAARDSQEAQASAIEYYLHALAMHRRQEVYSAKGELEQQTGKGVLTVEAIQAAAPDSLPSEKEWYRINDRESAIFEPVAAAVLHKIEPFLRIPMTVALTDENLDRQGVDMTLSIGLSNGKAVRTGIDLAVTGSNARRSHEKAMKAERTRQRTGLDNMGDMNGANMELTLMMGKWIYDGRNGSPDEHLSFPDILRVAYGCLCHVQYKGKQLYSRADVEAACRRAYPNAQ